MKKKSGKLPRILKINEINGFKISVFFSNGEDRVLDFKKIFDDLKVNKKSPEFKLLDLKEFKKVTINNHTLSWNNVSTLIEFKNKILELPYEIGSDVLFDLSTPDTKRAELSIGDILKSIRIKEGLTQIEVANLSGTSRTYISRIENNQSDIELYTLARIVKAGFNKKLKLQIV